MAFSLVPGTFWRSQFLIKCFQSSFCSFLEFATLKSQSNITIFLSLSPPAQFPYLLLFLYLRIHHRCPMCPEHDFAAFSLRFWCGFVFCSKKMKLSWFVEGLCTDLREHLFNSRTLLRLSHYPCGTQNNPLFHSRPCAILGTGKGHWNPQARCHVTAAHSCRVIQTITAQSLTKWVLTSSLIGRGTNSSFWPYLLHVENDMRTRTWHFPPQIFILMSCS